MGFPTDRHGDRRAACPFALPFFPWSHRANNVSLFQPIFLQAKLPLSKFFYRRDRATG
jgi:hypothetical protein